MTPPPPSRKRAASLLNDTVSYEDLENPDVQIQFTDPFNKIKKRKGATRNERYREWDIRLNVPEDDEARAAYLGDIIANIASEFNTGTITSVLVSGVEIGTVSHRTDYGHHHVHVAVIFKERRSQMAIYKSWGVDTDKYAYWGDQRNPAFPYSGWWDHHTKEFSKISKDPKDWCLFKRGQLPSDYNKKRKYVVASKDEVSLTADERTRKIKEMFAEGASDKEVFERFPNAWVRMGARIKGLARAGERHVEKEKSSLPHLWVWGEPGTGKTQVIKWLFPEAHLKDLTTHFWNGFDPAVQKEVILEDLDHEAVQKLGSNFFKQLTNEAGYRYDQKYEVGGETVSVILVTSNHTVREIFGTVVKYASEVVVQAMERRFLQCNIEDLLRTLGLKLVSSYDRAILKKRGNLDASKLFCDWDYLRNEPTGEEVKAIDYYHDLIRDAFYGVSV